MLVLRRRDPTDGDVDNIPCDAKLNIRRDGFYRILQPTDNLRTPCKVVEESTTVDSSDCGEGDIEWESILSNSREEMPRTGAIHHPWEAGTCKFRIREIAVGKVQGSFGLDRITELYD